MKVLVTGGAGFIGSHVADAFLSGGHQVVIVDNLSSGRRENLPGRGPLPPAGLAAPPRWRGCSPTSGPRWSATRPPRSASPSPPAIPLLDARVNALGMLSLLEAAARAGVRKIVFASSGGAIYGEYARCRRRRTNPRRPLSPYGIHKLLGEHYLRYYRHQHGLDSTVLRYSNVYGPRQNPEGEAGVVAIFARRLLEGRTPTLFAYPDEPDGMTRDYVYVGDVAEANRLALEAGSGEVVNIGTGRATSTGELLRRIEAVLGVHLPPERAAARPGDLRHSCLDASRAREVLRWQPRTDLARGLTETIEYFRKTL